MHLAPCCTKAAVYSTKREEMEETGITPPSGSHFKRLWSDYISHLVIPNESMNEIVTSDSHRLLAACWWLWKSCLHISYVDEKCITCIGCMMCIGCMYFSDKQHAEKLNILHLHASSLSLLALFSIYLEINYEFQDTQCLKTLVRKSLSQWLLHAKTKSTYT